uniref:Uncharacterized protein n=1 Tax=Nelumbo nucifera TaxID=4432 RepID=A0A822Z676_NELNU|nr:TPA_asm: hypothetical protein HUJ06_009117 [Nelumbo nucifera]
MQTEIRVKVERGKNKQEKDIRIEARPSKGARMEWRPTGAVSKFGELSSTNNKEKPHLVEVSSTHEAISIVINQDLITTEIRQAIEDALQETFGTPSPYAKCKDDLTPTMVKESDVWKKRVSEAIERVDEQSTNEEEGSFVEIEDTNEYETPIREEEHQTVVEETPASRMEVRQNIEPDELVVRPKSVRKPTDCGGEIPTNSPTF